MGKRTNAAALLVTSLLALAGMGCSSTRVMPSPAATQTESIVIVVVTATPLPVFEATQINEPTITPLATFTPIGLNSPTPTRAPTSTPAPRKTSPPPTATRTAVPPTAEPVALKITPTSPPASPAPSQNQYPAAEVMGPSQGTLINDGNAIPLQFRAVGPLAPNACYRIRFEFANPNAASPPVGQDWFFECGDTQHNPGEKITFSLTRYMTNPYNYIGLRDLAQGLAPSNNLLVHWSVAIARQDGVLLGPVATGFELLFQLH